MTTIQRIESAVAKAKAYAAKGDVKRATHWNEWAKELINKAVQGV